MTLTQTIAITEKLSTLPTLTLKGCLDPQILSNDPAEVVDMALDRLQRAGVQLIEWRALLYRRMNVPIVVTVSF